MLNHTKSQCFPHLQVALGTVRNRGRGESFGCTLHPYLLLHNWLLLIGASLLNMAEPNSVI